MLGVIAYTKTIICKKLSFLLLKLTITHFK